MRQSVALLGVKNMVGTKNNKRAQQTKKNIQKTVLSLLQQKKVDAITVTEVCQKAKVNRTTFYRYYDDIYMCVDKIESEFLNSVDLPQGISPVKAIRNLLTGFYENPQISNLVFVEGKTKLLDKMHNSMNHSLERPSVFNEYQDTFIMLGMQGILKRWVKNGMKETPDELTQIIIKITFADNLQDKRSLFLSEKNSEV